MMYTSCISYVYMMALSLVMRGTKVMSVVTVMGSRVNSRVNRTVDVDGRPVMFCLL